MLNGGMKHAPDSCRLKLLPPMGTNELSLCVRYFMFFTSASTDHDGSTNYPGNLIEVSLEPGLASNRVALIKKVLPLW